jgi:Acyclic terpene utilisation family protein AtuA
MAHPAKPFRIAAGAGYAGDRIDPAQALAERGELDALVFECLAERTIALAQLRRAQDPRTGFDPLLPARLRAVLPACIANGVQIITNMGAAHPEAAGAAALEVARELGLPQLRVAVVTGDDVLAWMRAHDAPLLDSGGQTVRDLCDRLISANAYLGADALLPALASGAQLVITGRVADPALFLAPLMAHFGWAPDDWPLLGRGTAVGHLLECAGLDELGFPLAEVQADGRCVITKLAGTGGRVDRLSCTAQLLYEIENPARYVQPDVVADFSGVRLHEVGPDRVSVDGASGHARPDQLKVTLGYRDGFIGEGQISYAGPGARARGELALAVMASRLQRLGLGALEQRAELIGVNAMHGPLRGTDREPYEVRLRVALRCATRAQAEQVGQEVEALYLNGPAGGGGATQSVREVVAVASALIPRAAVTPRCSVLEAKP